MPEASVLTSEAYAMISHFSRPLGLHQYLAMIEMRLLDYAPWLINDFEEPIFAKLPELARLKSRMLDAGAAWAIDPPMVQLAT